MSQILLGVQSIMSCLAPRARHLLLLGTACVRNSSIVVASCRPMHSLVGRGRGHDLRLRLHRSTPGAATSMASPSSNPLLQFVRHSSEHDPLDLKIIEERTMLVLNLYDKIDNNKVRRRRQY